MMAKTHFLELAFVAGEKQCFSSSVRFEGRGELVAPVARSSFSWDCAILLVLSNWKNLRTRLLGHVSSP